MTTRRQPSLPPRIPGFEYVGLLGMGGFADVFEYRQDFPRRSVAVKVLLSTSLEGGARDAFFAEANIMAALSQHPSIVTIHQAAIASDGRPYFVMEYCGKPSLGQRFRTERISVAETLRTGIRVASAVETAHRSGVLHRDIKPANILATDFGWPALTDFGIAGTIGEALLAHGMSIPWAPPEMLSDEPSGDARTDVYSLAATLYSLLAGRSPFEVRGKSNSPVDLITRIERDPLRPVDRVDVPHELNIVLARAMSKDPEQRFSSAFAFAHALQNIEREMQLPVTGIDVTDLRPPRPPAGQELPPVPAPTFSDRSLTVVRGQDAEISDDSGEVPASYSPVSMESSAGADREDRADEEATNLRSVTSINPDAAVGDDPYGLSGQALSQADIETRLRPVTTIHTAAEESSDSTEWSSSAANNAAHPITVPQFDDSDGAQNYFFQKRQEAESQQSKANRRLTVLVSLLSVLVLIGVVIYVGLNGVGNSPDRPETPTADPVDTAITDALETVPSVTSIRVTKEFDTELEFAWDNPDPQEGDAFVWRVIDPDSNEPLSRTTNTAVKVKRQGADERVCIEVSLVRANGKASSTPSKECTK